MIELKNYSGKNVAVFGLGITGLATIKALLAGNANVYAWDDINNPDIPKVNFIHPSKYNWNIIDLLILSPGIPLKYPQAHEVVTMTKKVGCRISSDIDLLYESQPQAKFIGVTGTNGKSSTASLIQHILTSNGVNSCLGGNIGIAALDLENGADVYVLEMSSYQLDLCSKINFDISIILNITPDHLDRHKNIRNYIAAKKKICGKISIIGLDNNNSADIYKNLNSKKIGFSVDKILKNGISLVNKKVYKDSVYKITLTDTNIINENIAAAYVACSLLKMEDKQICNSIKAFINLAHRIEFVRKIGNTTFINDSKATNAVAAQKALSKYENIYWIAGGIAKDNEGISNIDLTNVKKIFLIGKATEEFSKQLNNRDRAYTKCNTLEKAVKIAYSEASQEKNNSVILLSPACSSFDQWKNFEERGDSFKEFVQNIDA